MLDRERIEKSLLMAEQDLRKGVGNVPDEEALMIAQVLPLIIFARALVSGDVEIDPYDGVEEHPLG